MNIEIGDTVQKINKPSNILGALEVIDIIGNNAICAYYLLNEDFNGSVRPNLVKVEEGTFPLEDLIILKKRVV